MKKLLLLILFSNQLAFSQTTTPEIYSYTQDDDNIVDFYRILGNGIYVGTTENNQKCNVKTNFYKIHDPLWIKSIAHGHKQVLGWYSQMTLDNKFDYSKMGPT